MVCTTVLSATNLRKEALAAGHKLFDNHRSGLIFSGDIEILTLKEYGEVYDTFDYVFSPKAQDLADTPVKLEHAVDGVIHVAGADGIKLIKLPRTNLTVEGELKMPREVDEGATWTVIDKAGYSYSVGPRRGQPPLSYDPDEALKQIQSDRVYGVFNAVRIEK